jgi:NIMA-interacting peptidyl-prolyl cis-trans isomerase 1
MTNLRQPIALLLVVSAMACGGAPSEGAASPSSASAAPGARCLADADVKHERKASEPDRVNVKHVLVRYSGARGAATTVTRDREHACLRAEEALGKLKAGTSFEDVVATYTDETGAGTRGGRLGDISRSDVLPPFADVAFELQVGEVSQVVETPFGFHIILRVE